MTASAIRRGHPPEPLTCFPAPIPEFWETKLPVQIAVLDPVFGLLGASSTGHRRTPLPPTLQRVDLLAEGP